MLFVTQTRIPAAFPALDPMCVSSMTTHRVGFNLIVSAAWMYMSGHGFLFFTTSPANTGILRFERVFILKPTNASVLNCSTIGRIESNRIESIGSRCGVECVKRKHTCPRTREASCRRCLAPPFRLTSSTLRLLRRYRTPPVKPKSRSSSVRVEHRDRGRKFVRRNRGGRDGG